LVTDRLPVIVVCDGLGIPRSSYYAALKPKRARVASKQRSARALGEAERQQVVEILHSPRFVNRAPTTIVATLLDEGKYLCSARTMYRILKSLDEVRERRAIARRPAYKKPELLAVAPNQVWSWDITKIHSFEKWVYFYLYVLLDIFSRYVVGYLIAERESSELARELIEESCKKQNIVRGTLKIHSDRGTPMKSKTVKMLYTDMGIDNSFSRPSVSDDNPYSEAHFKTVKYCPLFPGKVGSLTEARNFGRELFAWYNCEHRHSGIAYYTPDQVHHGRHLELHKTRGKALFEAYAKHPERFKSMPTPKLVPGGVWINPPTLTPAPENPGLAVDLFEKSASGIFVQKKNSSS
jgi:putative transposase